MDDTRNFDKSWVPYLDNRGTYVQLDYNLVHLTTRNEIYVKSDKRGIRGDVLAVATGHVSSTLLALLRTIAHTMTFFTAVDTRYNRSSPSKFSC